MSMDERAARRVMLAQAIETADAQGRLVSELERDQIDSRARRQAGVAGEEAAIVAPEHFLDLRARLLLDTVQGRNASLAALQEPAAWQAWLTIATPLLA